MLKKDYELVSKCIDNMLESSEIVYLKKKIANDIVFAREYREIKKVSSIIKNNMVASKREYIFDMTDEVLGKILNKTKAFQPKHRFLLNKQQSLLQLVFEHFEELLLKALPFLK